jgi:hypothetical protein
MGVDFYCGDVTFGCSYGGWNELRRNVIKATFDYIQDKFQREEELYKNITDEEDDNFIGEGSTYNCYKKDIIKLIEAMNSSNTPKNVFGINIDNTINNFINLCRNLSHVDSLIYFDIGGLYSFCNKSDCEGFYSVGNSVDICQLFDLIEPFIEKNSKDTYSAIYKQEDRIFGNRAYDLFKESATQNKRITIR